MSNQTTSNESAGTGVVITIFGIILITVAIFTSGLPGTGPEDDEDHPDTAALQTEPTAVVLQSTATATLSTTSVPSPTAIPTQPPTTTPIPTSVPTLQPTPLPTEAPTAEPTVSSEQVADEGAAAYDPALVAEGETNFVASCSACHGPDARGIPGLGKDLLTSEFVESLTDEELLDFVKVGRPLWDPANTTGVDMPPKGGNPALTDDQILAIIAFVRTEAANVSVAEDESISATTGTEESSTEVAADAATSKDVDTAAYDPAMIAAGETNFMASCSACHGPDAHGIPGLGKDLVTSEFVDSLTDPELVDFVKVGRPLWDPANTTGVDMPPKGGNPALTDEQILAIIAYVRSIEE